MAAVGRLVGFNDAYRQVGIYTGRISQGGRGLPTCRSSRAQSSVKCGESRFFGLIQACREQSAQDRDH
jgi:hypothetical protein